MALSKRERERLPSTLAQSTYTHALEAAEESHGDGEPVMASLDSRRDAVAKRKPTVFHRYGHLFPGNGEPVMASLDDAVSAAPRLHLVTDPAEPARIRAMSPRPRSPH